MRSLLLVALLAAGCRDASPEGTAHAATRVGGPVATTPRELFADFTQPDAEGLRLLDKYRDGATFTGTLTEVDAEGGMWIMDVDGTSSISLAFENPQQARTHKAGDRVTVTCRIGGASGALMLVSDCVL